MHYSNMHCTVAMLLSRLLQHYIVQMPLFAASEVVVTCSTVLSVVQLPLLVATEVVTTCSTALCIVQVPLFAVSEEVAA